MYSKCLMCMYVFGRKCLKTNSFIEDDIYENKKECINFKSIENEDIEYPNDTCCSENSDYYEKN